MRRAIIRALAVALARVLAGLATAASQAPDTGAFVAPNTAEWAQCRDTLDTDKLSRFIVAQDVVLQDTTKVRAEFTYPERHP